MEDGRYCALDLSVSNSVSGGRGYEKDGGNLSGEEADVRNHEFQVMLRSIAFS